MRYRPPNKIGREPVDWEANMKKFDPKMFIVGVSIFAFLGVPFVIASMYAFEVLDWLRAFNVGVIVRGHPARSFLITGGVFGTVGLLVVLLSLPQRSKK